MKTPVYNSTESAQDQNAARFYNDSLKKDAALMLKAYSSGLYAMKAAEQAETRAASVEVKALARKLALENDTLNHQLLKLASIKGIALPDSLTDAQRERLGNENNRTGAAYDKAFITGTATAIREAIVLYKQGGRESTDKDISAWFSSALPELRNQLNRTQKIADKMKTAAQ